MEKVREAKLGRDLVPKKTAHPGTLGFVIPIISTLSPFWSSHFFTFPQVTGYSGEE
jgi:hypothetical protein